MKILTLLLLPSVCAGQVGLSGPQTLWPIHPDARAWAAGASASIVNRAIGNGISFYKPPHEQLLRAIDRFCRGLQDSGLKSKMIAIYPCSNDQGGGAGDVTGGPLTPIYFTNKPATSSGTGFNANPNGLASDANGGKYAAASWQAASDPRVATNNIGMSFYVMTMAVPLAKDVCAMGANGSGASRDLSWFVQTSTGGSNAVILLNEAANAGIYYGPTNDIGFYSFSKVGAGAGSFNSYFANSSVFKILATAGDNIGTLPSLQMYLMNRNDSGSGSLSYTNTYSLFAFHQGLTAAQTTNFFRLVQQYRIDLGGGFR